MLIDSHCHLGHDNLYNIPLDHLVKSAHEMCTSHLVSLATDKQDLPRVMAHINHPNISVGIGLHPCAVTQWHDIKNAIVEFSHDQRIAVIGETGLDYFHPAPNNLSQQDYYNQQIDALYWHFELAKSTQRNIVLHTRDKTGDASFQQALKIYQEYAHDVRAVFHCFLGTLTDAEKILSLGGLVSFTAIATFSSAKQVLATVQQLPKYTFMVETDAPFLAPKPYRGKTCYPSYLKYTAKYIAQARGESLTELAEHTSQTARTFFRISTS